MSSAASSSSSSSAPAQSTAEETAALLWERAWSLEEVRAGSQCWSLAADAGLLHFLQDFSQQTISRTHEIKKQMDRLIHETKSTDCRLHNVFNGFLMLSNTQFIENRVYDDEVEEPILRAEVGDQPEQEKTREQKEANLIPKIQEAVNYGLQVLDSAFEQLDIKAGNSDSEEETNERVELILEPKDLYIDRPLPYLIGSQLFMEQDDIGLGDLSSEEGSVDSDRGSMIDSEGKDEEELEEEFENRTALMSDEDDFFGDSEKGEEEEGDLGENARLKKKRPTSFTDQLAARIKEDVLFKQEEEQTCTKNKTTVTDKEEVSIPSDDDDIFKPPKLTDEDFSPFCSKDGLFSGGIGLFDDEESDLFAELPKGEAAIKKEARVPINDEPSSKAKRKVPAGAVSLFPDKSAADLFEAEGGLFKEKPDITNVIINAAKENKELTAGDKNQPSAENFTSLTQTLSKGHKSLFSDEEDSDDLFSYKSKAKSSSMSSSKVTTKMPLSLFEDEDEEGLFGSVPKTQLSKRQQDKATSLLFNSDEEDHWNITQEVNPASECSQKKEPTNSASAVSLFEEEREDLFITKDSQRKSQKADLFEEDAVNGDSFFSIQPSRLPSSGQEITADSLRTPQNKLVEEKAEPLNEPGTLHSSGLGEQKRKDKLLSEKDVKRKIKSVFSLFEEEEKNEDTDIGKSTLKETGKPPDKTMSSKSTGVFQDEELLFSHKLQKDNDPDVDLFASNKKQVPKSRIKLSSGGGLFGNDDDGDDGLFSSSKAKPLVAEKKATIKKSGTISLEEDSRVLETDKNAKEEEESRVEATEKSTGLGASKRKESSSRIGTLQGRIKMTGKRRPPTRTARRLVAQESNKNEMSISEDPFLAPLKESSVPPAILYPYKRELCRKENTEKFTNPLPLPINSSDQLHDGSPVSKSKPQSDVQDLFESNDIFANSVASKVALRPKEKEKTESLISQVPKGGEWLSVPLALDGANCEGHFHAGKLSKKPDPAPCLEDEEDLFTTSKKTVKRKDPKSIAQSNQDPPIQDIFEGDIFASEALEVPVKAKEPKAILFDDHDDDVDIFADLAVKPKERSAKKKMESKSIFDEDIDDIFSPSSQSKTSTKKTQPFEATSGTKFDYRTSSTFEDPLNAFEGQ
ncbi:WASH complex subunit 2-like isoform X3 [Rhineura floridana]|uniref:WASH complex subunit 2-like isoform X3 n=1 Tax=Rhineura floridana TaxID=261503 RepID=UPI002AC81CEC|nr:WASH complex subunit 2-like isoform X3 [Rhineura floridana]